MDHRQKRSGLGSVMYFAITISLCVYFTFAAVQGDYGVFRRIEIEAEARVLREEKADLQRQVSVLRNKTHRLSDGFLDLDLLDQQARDVLGLIRADEIVIR
ncbi:septum formation initiator family protein [Alphaproteobacteria bacterium KMM 3653]|uniref:Septum formation initiator family protein n=2 Tax=Harenicola maris TaxID=2841044 RepID=A0AAP2CSZ4_9RHOB|nr:septum formation initiator family protein [Harenicola maris]